MGEKTPVNYRSDWANYHQRFGDQRFEWIADWDTIKDNVLSILESSLSGEKSAAQLRILVPGCGTSRLSEELYDEGFKNSMNFDISTDAIKEMLERYVRVKPEMKWRVRDMADLTFSDDSFDIVLDKGGLETVMVNDHVGRIENLYLSKVKKILTTGGKFICISHGAPPVMRLLFNKFLFGWSTTIAVVPKTKDKCCFVIVLEKEDSASIGDILFSYDKHLIDDSLTNKVLVFDEAIKNERQFRGNFINNKNSVYALDDLLIGARGDILKVEPGRRLRLILGEQGVSSFHYNGVLLDDVPYSDDINTPYQVTIVPKSKSCDETYASETGQWRTVSNSKCCRLLLVLLDSSNSFSPTNAIWKDLAPLAEKLIPHHVDFANARIVHISDGIENQNTLYEVVSDLSGRIVVEDVKCEKDLKYRHFTLLGDESIVQLKAPLSTQVSIETEKDTKHEEPLSTEMEVDHNTLTSPYHNVILLGIIFNSSHLLVENSPRELRAVIIGLGGGVLPMYLKKNLPSTPRILVFELDPKVLVAAEQFLGFKSDDKLKVHFPDDILDINNLKFFEEGSWCKPDIIILDVDSRDMSSGLSCPGEDYVEDSFLSTAKEALSGDGMLVMNLVSRSPFLKEKVYARLKKVFCDIIRKEIEEDVSEVIFALKTEISLKLKENSEDSIQLATSLGLEQRYADFIKSVGRNEN